MIGNLIKADADYGKRVIDGLKRFDLHSSSEDHIGTKPANEGMELSSELGHSTDGY